MLFGQRHKEIARADDLVDPRQTGHAIRQGRHGLRTAGPHHLRHAEFLAGGQNMRVF